jgi:hypothetical protein
MMKTGAEKKIHDEADFVSAMLRQIAGKKLTVQSPLVSGASHFYEVAGGWETDIFKGSRNVKLVMNVRDLEDAFLDTGVRTIFIPRQASVTRNVALRVCRRHGQGKSVFFEVENHE